MSTIYQTWSETRALLEKHQLDENLIAALYEEEYILHPGSASISSLRLEDHDYRHANPWIKAGGRPQYEGIDGAVTGYVIDGDLTIDGSLVCADTGSPALIVLGDLRAKSIVLAGDTKLIVKGNIEVELFTGSITDGYFAVQGELKARVAIFWNEFAPNLAGAVRARVFTPKYYDPSKDEKIKQLVLVNPELPAAELFIPEVCIPVDPSNRGFASFGVDPGKLFDRVLEDQPVLR